MDVFHLPQFTSRALEARSSLHQVPLFAHAKELKVLKSCHGTHTTLDGEVVRFVTSVTIKMFKDRLSFLS